MKVFTFDDVEIEVFYPLQIPWWKFWVWVNVVANPLAVAILGKANVNRKEYAQEVAKFVHANVQGKVKYKNIRVYFAPPDGVSNDYWFSLDELK